MVKQLKKHLSKITPWAIWGLAAFFFFSHYVIRVTPGHISHELQAVFINSTKSDVGIIGSSFYFPYIAMQMPVGYLVDKFGSRLLLTLAALICSLSAFLFAHASLLTTIIASRVLLGFASATAFIAALKLITVWFEPKKLALLVGITQALGMVGAAAGARIAPYLNAQMGWQNMFHVYVSLFFVLAVLIFAIIRNRPKQAHLTLLDAPILEPAVPPAKHIPLTQVILNKYTWINALYAGCIFAPTDAMGEFWGQEFLQHIHHLSPTQASHAIFYLFVGWAIGGPLAGTLADHYGRRPVMLFSAISGCVLLPFLFYVPLPHPTLLMGLLFLYGLTNTGLVASYTVAGELNKKEHSGFSIAIANMLSVLIGALLMPVLGHLIDLQAAQSTALGIPYDTTQHYMRATYLLPVFLFTALICAFFSKETLKESKRKKAT